MGWAREIGRHFDRMQLTESSSLGFWPKFHSAFPQRTEKWIQMHCLLIFPHKFSTFVSELQSQKVCHMQAYSVHCQKNSQPNYKMCSNLGSIYRSTSCLVIIQFSLRYLYSFLNQTFLFKCTDAILRCWNGPSYHDSSLQWFSLHAKKKLERVGGLPYFLPLAGESNNEIFPTNLFLPNANLFKQKRKPLFFCFGFSYWYMYLPLLISTN